MPDSPPPDQAAPNSLGLDLDALKLKDDPDPAQSPSSPKDAAPSDDATRSPEGAAGAVDEADDKDAAGKKEPKEKKKPYVNPDRVKTGGAQRVRLPFRNRACLRVMLNECPGEAQRGGARGTHGSHPRAEREDQAKASGV